MKKLCSILAVSLWMLAVVFWGTPLTAEAANVTSGTLGDNGNIQWTYDADTKTLTMTGEDRGDLNENWESVFKGICPEVEHIVVKDCKLYDCYYLFANLDKVQSITFDNFDTSQAWTMNNMFRDCVSLTQVNVNELETENVTGMFSMFGGCSSLTALDVSGFNTSKVTDMGYMFDDCSSLTSLNVSNFDTSKVTSMPSMFGGCSGLTTLDISNFDTSKVVDMNYMFDDCSSLTNLNVDNFNTSQVISMQSMFGNCSSLTSLNVGNFDTSNVITMKYMFNDCSGLTTLDVSNFNTSSVTDMSYMFWKSAGLKSINLNGFDTSSVTDMQSMFNKCSSLTSLDLSGFDTTLVTSMDSMFWDCGSLTNVNVSSFNTSNVTDMKLMFSGCSSLSDLDVTGFDTSKVTKVTSMFSDCSKLKNLDLSSFDLTQVTAYKWMFSGCDSLITIKAPKLMNADQTIDLPGTFVDAQKNKTKVITKDMCNTTLLSELGAFVERMYTVALGRGAAAEEIGFYVDRLLAGDSNGACLAESFLCSPEFTGKGHSNEAYLTVLYKVFFDREPAAEEVSYWVGKINEGQSRAFVLSGFVNSVEFDNLCADYGISRGYMYQDGKPANPGLGRFAERLYTCVLGRAGEKEGIEYWTLQIAGGACTPKDAAKGFFNSKEYVDKQTSDEEYVKNLYATFMDRGAGADEISYHVGRLTSGTSRDDVLEGFANAPEFENIMKSFGL